jgi:undecaprenyl-diphosphatase
MTGVGAPVREAIQDAVANVITPAALLAALVGVLLLGAWALAAHRLAAAAVRAGALLAALTALTVGVLDGRVTGLDTATTDWFVAHRSVGLDVVAVVITDIGSPAGTAVVGLVCGVFLWWRSRSVIPGVVVVGTVAAAALASATLKAMVARPRPPLGLQLIVETDHSFPSGHVTGTAALLGIGAVCVGAGRSRAVRAWLSILAIAGTVVVALTRLYLGVHWLTDVTAGAVLAALFVTLGATVFGAIDRRPGRHDTTLPDEAPVDACR